MKTLKTETHMGFPSLLTPGNLKPLKDQFDQDA